MNDYIEQHDHISGQLAVLTERYSKLRCPLIVFIGAACELVGERHLYRVTDTDLLRGLILLRRMERVAALNILDKHAVL